MGERAQQLRYLWRPKDSIAGAGVTRCWALSPSPQQKLPIFVRTETALQPPNIIFSRIFYMCIAH